MPQQLKTKLHPRNKHRKGYNFDELKLTEPELAKFIRPNAYGNLSLDFSNPTAVKLLNKALLKKHYGLHFWDLPTNYLVPPIPGRADYIHHIADLLGSCNRNKIPKGNKVTCLDIGTGSSCIYPIIGNREYGWSFVGIDIDPVSIKSAEQIISLNPVLKNEIEIRHQPDPNAIFENVISKDEYFDVVVCNPPFHSSAAEALAATKRKLKNLKGGSVDQPVLNFGGQEKELWTEGGEEKIISNMIRESRHFATSCFWFTTLLSKQSIHKKILGVLKKTAVTDVKTIEMGQGNKVSRIVAWTFLKSKQQQIWTKSRWS